MTDRSDWEGRTGRKWADEWRRTDRAFAGLTDRLLAIVRSDAVGSVLDVGCGAGELSLAIAREHAGARVTGLDISEPLIEEARGRGERLGNARFYIADASDWHQAGFTPDLVVSRHGVMFFEDPTAAFAHLASIAAVDARLVFSCFRDRELNPWASRIAGLLPAGAVPVAEPRTPGPFAFSERAYVESILAGTGWQDVDFEPVDFAYVAGSGEDPLADARTFFLAIGPAAAAAVELQPEERQAFVGRLGDLFGRVPFRIDRRTPGRRLDRDCTRER